jgi:hypothetical protein
MFMSDFLLTPSGKVQKHILWERRIVQQTSCSMTLVTRRRPLQLRQQCRRVFIG